MYVSLLIIVGLLVVTILLSTGVIPTLNTSDLQSPLNFFMFQAPTSKYSDQLVNMWVEKPWRSDGKRIPCKLEESSDGSIEKKDRILVLYSHGNAEDILNCVQFIRELSSTLKVDVLCWDYSGYGLNEADNFERTTEGINLSLRTIWGHLIKEKGYQAQNIILWGYSLGSGPSVHLALHLCQAQTPPRALILFGAYSSILDVVRDKTHKHISAMFEERWDSKSIIGMVTCPILIMHGQSDGLIGYHHAEVLKVRNPSAKLILMPNTGHTRFSWGEATKEVKQWLDLK